MIKSVVGVFTVFVEFLLPLVIPVYCYARILWIIKARIGSNMGSEDTQRAKFELARSNLIKTLFIVAFFFVICFLGKEVYYLLYGLGFEVDWNSGLTLGKVQAKFGQVRAKFRPTSGKVRAKFVLTLGKVWASSDKVRADFGQSLGKFGQSSG